MKTQTGIPVDQAVRLASPFESKACNGPLARTGGVWHVNRSIVATDGLVARVLPVGALAKRPVRCGGALCKLEVGVQLRDMLTTLEAQPVRGCTYLRVDRVSARLDVWDQIWAQDPTNCRYDYNVAMWAEQGAAATLVPLDWSYRAMAEEYRDADRSHGSWRVILRADLLRRVLVSFVGCKALFVAFTAPDAPVRFSGELGEAWVAPISKNIPIPG